MSSTLDLDAANLINLVDGLAAIILSPVIVPIATIVKQPIVQATVKEGIAISEQLQDAVSNFTNLSPHQHPHTAQYVDNNIYQNQDKSEVARDIVNVIKDINSDLERVTNGIIDLRIIVPFTIGLLALRQLLIKGVKLDDIPWYILAWYAFDMFVRLNEDRESKIVPLTNSNVTANLQN
jgi:hypothetical protein